MIPLFENAGIIGLGLIGGSLARAMRANSLAQTITGYARSQGSVSKALELGVIDVSAPSLPDLADCCDIIIICTPLSTYEAILGSLAPNLANKHTIITDVGSLKSHMVTASRKMLAPQNMEYVVPAHPIAGTEKTGVEAGFAELFQGKKTILTPISVTHKDVIEKVRNLWQQCGSAVEVLDAARHDAIYAGVSHLPQLVAYCYAHLLQKHCKKEDIKADDSFRQFTRIGASDPVIWIDILTMNLANVLPSLNNFVAALPENNTRLPYPALVPADIIRTLPKIISDALVQCSPDAPRYAGSGFKGMTVYSGAAEQKAQETKNGHLVAALQYELSLLSGLLQKGDVSAALAYMQEAAVWYRDCRHI